MESVRTEAIDLNKQGEMLLKAGNLEAAKEKFDKAAEHDPMCKDTYRNYGDYYVAKEQYQDAKNAYKKAMLIEKDGLLYFLYGNVCFLNNEPHEGLENYNLAIANGYDSDEMMFFMGMAYEHMSDDNMALRYFQRACAKNPSRPDYLVKKIGAEIRLDMFDAVEKDADQLIASNPEYYDGYHIKTELLIHNKRFEEAAAFARMASDRFPEDADLKYDHIKATYLAGDTKKALEMIQNAAGMKYFEKAKYKFVLLKAEIFAEKGEIDNAIAACEECIGLETEEFFSGEARFIVLNLYLSKKEYEKSLEHSLAIIGREERNVYYYAALFYKGFCLKQLGREEEAKKAFTSAASIYRVQTIENPAAVDIYLYRAMTYKELGDYENALSTLDFISDLGVELAEAHLVKAEVYELTEKKVLAEKERAKAYELKPSLNPKQ